MKLNPTFAKLAILAVVTVLLGIVLGQIGGLVRERQARQNEAAQSVEQSLAGPQTVLGPVLVRHCKETWMNGRGDSETRDFTLTAAPARLDVTGGLKPETRYRGLFKVNTYAGQLKLTARWADTNALTPRGLRPGSQVDCGEASAMVSVSDARGLRSADLQRDGQSLAVKPGTTHAAYASGLHAPLPGLRPETALSITLDLELVGTQRFGLVPAAGSTTMALQSSWQHPSFGGRFLPVDRQVGVSGFAGRWQVTELASNAAAQVAAGDKNVDTLDVELIDPVNPYVMSDRAIKYGLMFVALTFVTVGLTELLTGRRVHPVQYLLVGLAISLFFLLLLSLSEHMDFLKAYLVAAAAAAAVLTQYAAAMLGGWLRGLAFGGGIALLYGALYVLLRQEQTALVIGAVLLFAVLAVIMTLTRKLDWYRLGASAEA
ncbi:cell envelope integrity protein CreD [Pelomonas sp. P7]|uniref:Cell envelope integrity protein CreD n=1 Tax=Pelomonas caseinilytica TaxID=2906763 RepID=A0ABS8XJ33_9BURK|nr:cell envelope integrity protein CreD [Pelomonas sp. P7]MCE4538831.1 cell envelope integrity protein CreD [Pelomonas sp. P7]